MPSKPTKPAVQKVLAAAMALSKGDRAQLAALLTVSDDPGHYAALVAAIGANDVRLGAYANLREDDRLPMNRCCRKVEEELKDLHDSRARYAVLSAIVRVAI